MNDHYEPLHTAQTEETIPITAKKRTGLKITALALCCSLLGGAAGAGGVLLMNTGANRKTDQTTQILVGERDTTAVELASVDTGKQMTPAQVYAQNVNSTVGITTAITTNYFGFTTTSAASGSGFVLTEDGYILTNYHVVEGSEAITVTLYDGTAYEADLIGYDESLDTAILKVDAQDLVPVVLGDSDALQVGESVIAIGNPLGELTFSLTAGAVSALDREVTFSGAVTMDLIQTDCAINSGNSGGALFNLYGEVVGITNAKYSGNSASQASIDNIGFAIPINDVKNVVQSILEKGYLTKPYIGVSVANVSTETQSYGLPKGAAVKEVVAGSPAEKAGLQINDIVTEANGSVITGSSDLVDLIGDCAVGAEVHLTIYRQGETLELTLTVGEQIRSALANEETAQAPQVPQLPEGSGMPFFGFGG